MNEVIRAIEMTGTSQSRVSASITGEYIRDDGYRYLPKTVFRDRIHFSGTEYNHTRGRSGEVIIIENNGHYFGSVYFWKLPPGGGKVTVGNKTIKIELPRAGNRYINVAIPHDDRFLIEELRGEIERKLRMSFPCLGDLLSQSLLIMGARLNILPWSKASRWTRYGYSAACPKCKELTGLKSKENKFAWLVECRCQVRYIAISENVAREEIA